MLEGDAPVWALTAVLHFAATEEDRPVLCGVCLTLGDEVQVAAGGGYRLAWEGVPGRLPGEGHIILPAPAVRLLALLWKRAALSRGAPFLSLYTPSPGPTAILKQQLALAAPI